MENLMSKIKVRWVTALILFCAAGITSAMGQTFTSLIAFDEVNGANPLMSLVQGVDGRLYGTTVTGGAFDDTGIVFALGPGGLEVLYKFCAQGSPCDDGYSPEAGLVLASDGYFYGTVGVGGDNQVCCGTIFKIDRRGQNFSTVHRFQGTDGETPQSLIQAVDGFLYGTTMLGGGEDSQGAVFKMSLNGTLVVLHDFSGTDGAYPFAGLLQATDGNFYGTTFAGGADHGDCTDGGCGTLFKITPSGKFTSLYSFCTQKHCADGERPRSVLVQGTDGKLYGTTELGGEYGDGTIFRLSPNGRLTTLYSFCSQTGCPDGENPLTGLALGSDGNFYGTTSYGGNHEGGTAFSITPSGQLTTLYNFCSENDCADGDAPEGGLIQATDGSFYGTTYLGGEPECPSDQSRCGTIFKLDAGLGPLVTFVRAAGKVGQTGGILGQGLTGTTSVSLNGIPATFTVVSDTFIRATVPAGATTGYVTVITPSGTLTSNVPFHVIK
jgi:uncharacterized repeat protein (TIGR03803 family)